MTYGENAKDTTQIMPTIPRPCEGWQMDRASGMLPRGWLLPHLGALGAHPELKKDHFLQPAAHPSALAQDSHRAAN